MESSNFKPAPNSAGSDRSNPEISPAEEPVDETPQVSLTRASVKEVLVDSIATAMARKPVKLMLTISRTVDGVKIRKQKSIEIFTRDRQATAGILRLLGQELAMFKGESALPPVSLKLGSKEAGMAFLAKYYGVSREQIEKLSKDNEAAQKLSTDKQTEEDDDL